MTVNHTPEPWRVSSSTLVCTEQGRVVANCTPMAVEGLDLPLRVCIANAHLIATAPELLNACKAALMFPKETEFAQQCILNTLEAAIAKVEGWQP